MTLAQLARHLADPRAVEHAALQLVDSARELTLGELISLSSPDEKVQRQLMAAVGQLVAKAESKPGGSEVR
eukprot:1912101-Pyramimonas_sp.AAC.1